MIYILNVWLKSCPKRLLLPNRREYILVGWKFDDVIIYVCHYWIWPRQRPVAATSAPRGRHVSAPWPSRQRHVFKTLSPRHLPHNHHVICHIITMSSATSSLQVMWQVNPWRSLSSQILGFGLGSLGFTPIYDDLKMSWITTIHDETVNTSREVICDAQSMTKWNFVINVVLWRKLHDPWRKSTIIDHKVFFSETNSQWRPGLSVKLWRRISVTN
jgi:hypothetical protein